MTIPVMKLDLDNFKAYLEKHPRRLFPTTTKCKCPMAAWLQEEAGFDKVMVNSTSIVVIHASNTTEYQMPYWAYTFVRQFDGHHYRQPTHRLGQEAKAILETIPNN